MKKSIIIALLALMCLLAGCTGQQDALPEPVTAAPDWRIEAPTNPTEAAGEAMIQVHLDNTRSTHGFAGTDGPIVRLLTWLTDWARFDDSITTWILEPIQGTKDLEWCSRDPHFLQSALVRNEWDLYTIDDEDFIDGQGGPISTLFSQEADPNTVKVLVTDMLEQESALEPLTRYTQKLFSADTHQQVRIYMADSSFDGYVSFPVIIGEEFDIKSAYFSGKRPFAVIAAGPADAMEELHQIICESGVTFTEFMVENQRQPVDVALDIRTADVMQQNIFITDPAGSKCCLDVEPIEGLDGCFAFRYRKYSAQKESVSRVSVLIEVDEGREMTLGDLVWWEWQLPAQPDPTEESEVTEATEATEPVSREWVPCAAPDDAVLELKRLEPGAALSDRGAAESGVEDVTIPEGKWVYELSILMTGDGFTDKAYAVEAALNTGLPGNPLAEIKDFLGWSTSFATYGKLLEVNEILKTADPSSPEAKAATDLKDSILVRVPDLELLLRALAAMDTGAAETQVGVVKIILQNY